MLELRTIKNKIKDIEAQFGEPRPKFTGSYQKRVYIQMDPKMPSNAEGLFLEY